MAFLALIAIVLGGAASVWDELAAALDLAPDAVMVACNHAARDLDGRLDHWVTMHPELLPMWIKARASAGRPPAGQLWSARHRPSPVPVNTIPTVGGSSGLLSAMVALKVGADRVMLCGIPIHQNGRHYDRSVRWIEARQYLAAWTKQLPVLAGKVRSFGGETGKMLGTPTKDWLDGRH